jgi:hypothetical protein
VRARPLFIVIVASANESRGAERFSDAAIFFVLA